VVVVDRMVAGVAMVGRVVAVMAATVYSGMADERLDRGEVAAVVTALGVFADIDTGVSLFGTKFGRSVDF